MKRPELSERELLLLNIDPDKEITQRSDGSLRIRTLVKGESRAQQQFKDQCDVNQIIKKFKQTGSLTHVNNAFTGAYLDLSETPNYHEAMNVVAKANELFADVPAHIRSRFMNDPQNFMDFLADEKNHEEAIKLGLMTKREPPEVPKTEQLLDQIAKNTTQTKTGKTTSKKTAQEP